MQSFWETIFQSIKTEGSDSLGLVPTLENICHTYAWLRVLQADYKSIDNLMFLWWIWGNLSVKENV